jgi:hypothetical protein
MVNKLYEWVHLARALYVGVLQLHSDLACDTGKTSYHVDTFTRKMQFCGLLVPPSYIKQYICSKQDTLRFF